MTAVNGQKIILGSGKLYVYEYTGTIPADATIEVRTNLLAFIQGGATLTYKPEFYQAEDDLGQYKKSIITKESASLKSGLATINGDVLDRIIATARVTESGVSKKRTTKIGGLANNDGKRYVVRFVHEDAVDGDVRVTMVGSNQSELSMSFIKDKETVIDLEYLAVPSDNEGTLITIEEEIAGLVTLTVVSVAGADTGKTAISVTPGLDPIFAYMYKTAATVTLPEFGDDLTSGWTAWDGLVDITATTGHELAIAEVDSADVCMSVGKATVVSKT